MKKILFLANCQGAQFANTLSQGSRTFQDDWRTLRTIQAQAMKPADRSFLLEQMTAADVIVAQPLYSAPIPEVKHGALRLWAQENAKQLIVLPALQYDVVLATSIASQWAGLADYPFAATEDASIAAGFVAGLSPEAACRAFHDVPVFDAETLRGAVAQSIDEYRRREQEADCDILASPYYHDHWQGSRLHYAKGHPLPHVSRYFVARIAEALGIDDFEPGRTLHLLGAWQHAMPVKRWVRTALDLDVDANDTACCAGQQIPLEELIARLHRFYAKRGADAVHARLKRFGSYNAALSVYRDAVTA
ncbi:rb112 [Citreicella sp. 357]|nr:rb112 [Citreicella sp. 357]